MKLPGAWKSSFPNTASTDPRPPEKPMKSRWPPPGGFSRLPMPCATRPHAAPCRALESRHGTVAEGRRNRAAWRQRGRDMGGRASTAANSERLCRLTGEIEGGRRPTSGEDSAQRSASRVPGERLLPFDGRAKKAPGFRLTLANFAVLFSPLLISPPRLPPSSHRPRPRS